MSGNHGRPPVHDSLTVVDSETIYRNDEWWKAVVNYYFEDNADHDEVAVYLWHNDDGWSRKNKYVIKTLEAWHTDRTIIEQFLKNDMSGSVGSEFPVSDYYGVAGGQTVFESNGWWKAILNVAQKGAYETDEVMVYLWQKRDGDWYRRQKYTIKGWERWVEEKETIESVLDVGDSTNGSDLGIEFDTEIAPDAGVSEELAELDEELEAHLSGEYS